MGSAEAKPHPYKRALLFVDNSGADVVLGMLPLARELLRRGTEVRHLFQSTDKSVWKLNNDALIIINSNLEDSPEHSLFKAEKSGVCISLLFE